MENDSSNKLDELLKGKNPAQKQAITTLSGPVMIVAGAGSGKTTVLINRTANLLNNSVNPSNILLVTFTNKAATDIKDRLRESVGEKADFVNVGTFHSLFIEQILKKYKDHKFFADYGVDMERFSIIDDKDGEKLFKDAFEMLPTPIRQEVEGGTYNMSDMTSLISKNKSIGMDVNDFIRTIAPKDKDFAIKQSTALLWRNYTDLCIDLDGFDFDDILVVCNKLIESDPKVAIELASKFKFIMVDEYQDTNGVQMSVTDGIAMHHKNICVVGDEKQSIYAFRGSDIRVILGFEKRYSNVSKINMSMNYRSQKSVITVSNAVADAMGERLTDGQLESMSSIEKSDVKLVKFGDDTTEAKNIVKAVQRDLSKGIPGKEIAIIYRNKALKAEIEKQLVSKQVPYQLIGDTSFFQRAEVKDAIALLRFTFRPWDSMAGLRVLGATNFGVSNKGARDAMKQEKMPIYQYLCMKAESKRMSGELSAVGKKATAFLTVLNTVKRLQEAGSDPETLREFLADFWDTFMRPKLMASAKKSASKDAASNMDGKIENVHQIFTQFSDEYLATGDIDKVIDDLVLRVEATPEMDRDRHAKIQLMTIHASKGLEFLNVYLIGMDKQTLPGKDFSEMKEDEIEESRRLVYVGMTRCKSQLVMSLSEKRRQHGQYIATDVSPYLEEIMDRTDELKIINVPSEYSQNRQFQRS
jgi:DNA helicase-2/ATP-dependent DNA helicase PcrA